MKDPVFDEETIEAVKETIAATMGTPMGVIADQFALYEERERQQLERAKVHSDTRAALGILE